MTGCSLRFCCNAARKCISRSRAESQTSHRRNYMGSVLMLLRVQQKTHTFSLMKVSAFASRPSMMFPSPGGSTSITPTRKSCGQDGKTDALDDDDLDWILWMGGVGSQLRPVYSVWAWCGCGDDVGSNNMATSLGIPLPLRSDWYHRCPNKNISFSFLKLKWYSMCPASTRFHPGLLLGSQTSSGTARNSFAMRDSRKIRTCLKQ